MSVERSAYKDILGRELPHDLPTPDMAVRKSKVPTTTTHKVTRPCGGCGGGKVR